MRRTGPALLLLGGLAATAPAAADAPQPAFFVALPTGAAIPAAHWPAGDTSVETYDNWSKYLEPAWAIGATFGYLLPLADGPGCCLLGPEAGLEYVFWQPSERVDALRLRGVVGLRLAARWDWGWVHGRLAAGPELVGATSTGFAESPTDLGLSALAGGGVAWLPSAWVGLGLDANLIAGFHWHPHGDGRSDSPADTHYFDFVSLDVELLASVLFLL